MDILYLGRRNGTSRDRACAYARLGHRVTHIDLRGLLPRSPWIDHITWHLGDSWFALWARRGLERRLHGHHFDFCHVDSGEWIDSKTVRMLKAHCQTVINYNIDDPTGIRDVRRFNCYREAIPEYDLTVVVRQKNVHEVEKLGAKRTLRVYMSADEVSHAPLALTRHDHQIWGSEVLFIGTWMPGRGAFMAEMINRGVPISIRGARWQKAPEWEWLRSHWRGGHLEGDEYAKAIQCARVNIGLLSAENRDLHTTRSLEIPSLGGLFCGQRTPEHLHLYSEDMEALFWDTPEECATKCKWALAHPNEAEKVAHAGRARFLRNHTTNEATLRYIIEQATQP